MAKTTLLGISGSLRKGSYNTMLMRAAASHFAPDEFIEANLRFPLFDQDMETEIGIPAEVILLAEQIARADAVVIAGPEYNKSITGVLKNALDWVSRTKLAPWKDKPVAIMSAADGRAGGERTQFALRLCMMPFRPRLVNGPEVLVGNASEHFDDAGRLATASYDKFLAELMAALRAEIGR